MTLLAFMVLLNDFIYSTSGKRIINSNNSSRPTTTMTMIGACKKLQDDGGGKKLRLEQEAAQSGVNDEGGSANIDVEIEYVAEPIAFDAPSDAAIDDNVKDANGVSMNDGAAGHGEDGNPAAAAANNDNNEQDLREVLRRFQNRAAVVYVTDEEDPNSNSSADANNSDKKLHSNATDGNDDVNDIDDDNDEYSNLSKRKLKDLLRPSVAQLKQRVSHPELVEAHDITAPDPEFLVYLKGTPGTVPVPRHWGRKRKYLQGKRGVEKPPFALPDFIIKTGICDVRDATAEDESKMSIKQKNRMRVSGKGGAMDVDYRTLYEAFFVHQTKPEKLTKFGDLYYEGKEYETSKSSRFRPGYMSERLREALGMANEYSPPPWLINMQRYGPPPSYPNARIPGLNAPLPAGASYGYHVGGWGKPPVDMYGRPLYGGDPFGVPETKNDGMGGVGGEEENEDLYGLSYGGAAASMMGGIITSDGKALGKKLWGSLPSSFGVGNGGEDDEEDEEESSSEEESSEEEEDEEEEEEGQIAPPLTAGGKCVVRALGMDSVLPDGVDSVVPSSAVDLRKPGDETPMTVGGPPKQLYTILQQASADKDAQQAAVFASDHVYVLPGGASVGGSAAIPEGAASVLSKSVGMAGGEAGSKKRARTQAEDDEADELGKKFKF
ncbi:hypothetical protein ACHAXH_004518 [Discostella pseudostelligera]